VRRLLLFVATALGGLGIVTAVLLPSARVASPTPAWTHRWPHLRGAYHVHSQRSDGTGSIDEIAAAAARAGLQFVILTDHGNGTRPPEPPSYRSGVLCIDGVEISTDGGHYAALGLPQTPFALAGNARAVIEDVRYFGGFGIVAHPGSAKDDLAWTDWSASFDALEWLNADSEWRDEGPATLLRALMTYPWRPPETIASVLDRPTPILERWRQRLAGHRVPALAAADAHARLGLSQQRDPYEGGSALEVPAYEVSFAAFANRVVLNRQPTGNAAFDAALVLEAIREGRIYTFLDGAATGGAFEMGATSARGVSRVGEYLDPADRVVIDARLAAPEGTRMVLLRDGATVYETTEGALRVDVGTTPGAYWIEATLPDAPRPAAPWLFSNPIYVGLQAQHAAAATPPATPPPATTRTGIATAAWRAEADEGSASTLHPSSLPDGTPSLEWRFSLRDGPRREQYAAIWFPAGEAVSRHTRFQMRARSDQPRRLSIQLRAPGNERWVVYLFVDQTLRSYDVDFGEFTPATGAQRPRADIDRIDSLLLVVDTLNTLPGSAGTIWIPELWLAR
jgi:hypothetical protein